MQQPLVRNETSTRKGTKRWNSNASAHQTRKSMVEVTLQALWCCGRNETLRSRLRNVETRLHSFNNPGKVIKSLCRRRTRKLIAAPTHVWRWRWSTRRCGRRPPHLSHVIGKKPEAMFECENFIFQTHKHSIEQSMMHARSTWARTFVCTRSRMENHARPQTSLLFAICAAAETI